MITKLFWVLFVQTYSTFYLHSIHTHAMLDVLHIKNVCKWCISQSRRAEPSFFFWRSKCHKFPRNSISSDQLHCHLGLIYIQLGCISKRYRWGVNYFEIMSHFCYDTTSQSKWVFFVPLSDPRKCQCFTKLPREIQCILGFEDGIFILFTSF